MKFPILYAKASGKIKFWKIEVLDSSVKTTHGYLKSKKQTSKPIYFENYQKAFNYAKLKWENKIKKGYSASIKSLTRTILPMLASNYRDHKDKIIFPAYVQPKLDGVRGLAKKNIIITRNGNKIYNLVQIEKILDQQNLPDNYYLDGELFTFKLNPRDIKAITHIVNLTEEHKKTLSLIQFHIFDGFFLNNLDQSFEERYNFLKKNLKTNHYLKLVETKKINNHAEVLEYHKKYTRLGYEGVIIRNAGAGYHLNKRSTDLQKYKSFLDAEFKVIGFKEGMGNDTGTVIWQCLCKDGKSTFYVRPKGTREERQRLFKTAKKYIGKKLTVKYFELNEKTGCPLNPVGLGFRHNKN